MDREIVLGIMSELDQLRDLRRDLSAENAKLRHALEALYDRYDPYAMPDVDENVRVAEQARKALGRDE